jgi:uncharacterized protein
MKFLTFTDVHSDFSIIKRLSKVAEADDITCIIICGDFTFMGQNLRKVLEHFDKMPKPVYLIPGNHEEHTSFNEMVKSYDNITNCDRKSVKIGEYVLLGYGGGGFLLENDEYREIAREWYNKYKNEKIILLTHQPPYGTPLDNLSIGHVGCKDIRRSLKRLLPIIALSGHIHESAGVCTEVDGVTILNPGWDGKIVELPSGKL